MRIAIIGAGLFGLGSAYFLKAWGHDVTLFDAKGVGQGASKIGYGLCHAYPGRSGALSKYGLEALALTYQLVDAAEEALGKRVALRNGILRRGGWAPREISEDIQKVEEGYIVPGMTVDMPEYLRGLLQFLDLPLEIRKVTEEVPGFDLTLFAMGRGVEELQLGWPLDFVKGQVALAPKEREYERSVIDGGHLLPTFEGDLQIGSTYERGFTSDEPDREAALEGLREKLERFGVSEITGVSSGIRVCVEGSYHPLIKKVGEKSYVLTGLGSRGLLYHSYYGREVSKLIGTLS